jgi:RNA polymerase sigma-70 factor (ECF subfamily)
MASPRQQELALAGACAQGDPAALAAFESTYFDEVDRVARRLKSRGIRPDELRQSVRERLFLGTPDSPPRISTYSGKGDLRSWLRAVTMRAAFNMSYCGLLEQNRIDASVLPELPDLADDPELGFMKRHYRAQFDAAVAEAFAALSSRDRCLLSYAAVDKLTSEAIGLLYGVHRTTVKRWLSEIEDSLIQAVRDAMMRSLRVSPTELESILRLVRSRLDLQLADRIAAVG